MTLVTDPELLTGWLETAREAYTVRNQRLADLTDKAVNEFYSCTLCQSFAPDHVCIVSPERLGLCGAYNWLDCKASFSINPTGPNQPIKLGKLLDPEVGYWSGTIDYARQGSHGAVQEVSMYSIMENPMTACGCFECIVMYIPEVEGVMVVSREDVGMTPAGMKFSTLAGMAGGGVQTPGVMGVGKYYLVSPKFISADGGFKRVVWMSKVIKETMADELQHVAEREGIPDLIDRIADGDRITTVEELTDWVQEVHHPVLQLASMEREPAVLPTLAEESPAAPARRREPAQPRTPAAAAPTPAPLAPGTGSGSARSPPRRSPSRLPHCRRRCRSRLRRPIPTAGPCRSPRALRPPPSCRPRSTRP